jgi:hypothetical protein
VSKCRGLHYRRGPWQRSCLVVEDFESDIGNGSGSRGDASGEGKDGRSEDGGELHCESVGVVIGWIDVKDETRD